MRYAIHVQLLLVGLFFLRRWRLQPIDESVSVMVHLMQLNFQSCNISTVAICMECLNH